MASKKKIMNNKVISYIEAIVYVLLIIIAVFLCNCGPIYIKMFPILFALGLVGSIIFKRPVITTVFGIVTSLCIIKLTNSITFFENFFLSLCMGLNIALGELFGEYIIKSKKIYDKKKSLKSKGVISTYCITILIFAISIGVHIYTNGSYISYLKSRSSLLSYLNESYKDEKFAIIDCKYTFYKTNSYTFKMKNITRSINSNFIVIKTNNYAVYDEYKFSTISQNNTKLNEELYNYLAENSTDLDVKIGYIDSDQIKLVISKSVSSINKDAISDFANKTNEFISKLKSFQRYNDIDSIELVLVDKTDNKNNLISDIKRKDMLNENNYLYIFNSLNIEIID